MSRKAKKILLIIFLILILIVVGLIIYNKVKKAYKIEVVFQEKYLLLLSENKIGVIDNKGNIVIEPQYYSIHIPNPSKPLFICYYDYNENTKEVTLEQRNYFKSGDVAEFFGPNKEAITITIPEIKNSEGAVLDAARHPREIIKFKTNIKLEKMDMLRVKVFDISNYL